MRITLRTPNYGNYLRTPNYSNFDGLLGLTVFRAFRAWGRRGGGGVPRVEPYPP